MIVDDASLTRDLLREILNGSGYNNIIEAADSEEACELFDAEKPYLVILDIILGGKTGIDALKYIKGKRPGTKVLMCSAISQKSLLTV